MGPFKSSIDAGEAASLAARLIAFGVAGLTLAGCSSGYLAGNVDPRYGVAASARAVAPGEPVPKGGGVYRIGKPYEVAGKVYVPEEDLNYNAVGLASWYGNDFHGRYTANGEVFDMNSISAAHPTLPLPSYVRVTSLATHRSIIVRVNDRGPYVGGRLIDVSVKTAELLGFYGHGVTRVKVEYVGRAPLEGSDDRKLMATLREGVPAEPPVQVASGKSFVPDYSGRPVTNYSSMQAPSPPDRPYRLGEAARNAPPWPTKAPTPELAAAPRHLKPREPIAQPGPETIPVTAYGPNRYDGRTNFMGGRGLY